LVLKVLKRQNSVAALSPVTQKFILHWGEMGARWGVNRTVAQVHALLYLSPKPLNAEQIASTLSVARSNVSYSLRELQNWRLIKPVSVLGDRREHYESLQDVWEMFRIVIDERKRREIDPTLALLRECVSEIDREGLAADAHTRDRLRAMLDFFEKANSLYSQLRDLSLASLRKLASSGLRIRGLLGARG
jgi:DNA-binding transcriptional regulator GbsR (MarR family)